MAVNYKYIIDFVSNHTSFKQGLVSVTKDTKAAEAGVAKLAGTVKNDIASAGQAMNRFAQGDVSALPDLFRAGSSSAGFFSKALHGVKAALIATGIGAIIVALGTAIGALTRYFKGTEEGQIAFAQAMNKVKAYTEPVLQLFGRLGKSLMQLFKGDFKGAWSTVKEAFNEVDDGIRNNIKNLDELNELEAEIVIRRREAATEERRLQAEISELRNKANNEEIYNADQRKRFIDQALKLEKQLGDTRLGLANDELRLLEMKADQGDNDIATNDQINDLKNRALEIQRQTADESRRMLETQQRITREVQQEVEGRKAALAEMQQLATDVDLSLNTDTAPELPELVTTATMSLDVGPFLGPLAQMEKELARLKESQANALNPEDWQRYQAEIEATEQKIDEFQGKDEERAHKQQIYQEALEQGFSDVGQSVVNGLGLAETGLQGFIGTLLSTAVQAIAAHQAQAVAAAIAGGAESGAGTGPLAVFTTPAFIATMIGTVLSSFAAIPSFFTGGVIPGTSLYGDKMLIRANSGEEVLRRDDPRHSFNMQGYSRGGTITNVNFSQSGIELTGRKLRILLAKEERRSKYLG